MEFRSLITELEPHREVLAPTLPGSEGGPPLTLKRGSMLSEFAVEAMLDEAGLIDRVTIVGSSYGV